jgi:hypothetical protein
MAKLFDDCQKCPSCKTEGKNQFCRDIEGYVECAHSYKGDLHILVSAKPKY